MKLKIHNKFGNVIPLGNPEEIIIEFPYLGTKTLEKTLSRGGVRILSDQNGEIEVNLSDFDIEGFNEGASQSFSGKLITGDKVLSLFFERGLNVTTNEEGKKQIK